MAATVSNLPEAFRTMIVPMSLPPSPDESDAFLRFMSEQVVGCDDGKVLWPSPEHQTLAYHFCSLMQSQNLTPQAIAECLQQMQVGSMRAFWVEAQNGVVLVHRSNASVCCVYAWAAQLPTSEVIGTSPLRQCIPESAVQVPWSVVSDGVFASLLHDLSVNAQPEALPRSLKDDGLVQEDRNATSPMFVTEWLVRALGGEQVTSPSKEGSWALMKKVRDEARYGGGRSLWRRSSAWFALKSAMHLAGRLTDGRNPGLGRKACDLRYKLWVCTALARLLDCDKKIQCIQNIDGKSAVLEGSRKLARRVEKLRESNTAVWDNSGGPRVARICQEAVKRAVRNLEQQWNAQCKQKVNCQVSLTDEDIQDALPHKLHNSGAAIERLVSWKGLVNGNPPGTAPPSLTRVREVNLRTIEGVQELIEHLKLAKSGMPRQAVAVLHDVKENVIRAWEDKSFQVHLSYSSMGDRHVSNCVASKWASGFIDLISEYLQFASKFCSGDVRAESTHTILVSLTAVLLLDRVNCELFPLLKEHKLGIPLGNPQFLDALCLADRNDKQHLDHIEKYIYSRDTARGEVFVSGTVNSRSFSVKFAKGSSDMRRIHDEIQKECLRQEALKKAESKTKRARYDELTSKINLSGCHCRYNKYGCKISRCDRCCWITERNHMNISYHERLLPPGEDDQCAVVYELQEPAPLSCLRDALYLFGTHTFDAPDRMNGAKLCQSYGWKDDFRLSAWNKSRSSSLRFTFLTSTRKPWCNTHYSTQQVTAHPTFVVDNEKNCRPSTERHHLTSSNDWDWAIVKKCGVTLHQPRYEGLEEFVSSWLHNENQVLCSKSEAHRDRKVASLNIPLNEFEALGRLRAGVTLQLERLIKCIDQRSIQFREEDVITTVMALLWQVGPSVAPLGKGQTWFRPRQPWSREAWRHLCYTPTLVSDCARHARQLIEDSSENWDSHNVLLAMVLFLRAVSEHCIGHKDIADALRRARHIAKDWIGKVMEARSLCTEEVDVQKMHEKAAAIASTGVLTFLDHNVLMKDSCDVADFLFFRAVGRDSLPPSALKSHSWQRQHHLHAEAAAEMVLNRVHDLIECLGNGCLDNFLRLYWSEARTGCFLTMWHRCSRYGQGANDSWYETQFTFPDGIGAVDSAKDSSTCYVQLDALGGLFLVDGKPCKRLPDAVTCHPAYERLFGATVMNVQRDCSGGFITRTTVKGATYKFWEPSDSSGGDPIIMESRENTLSLLLHHVAMQRQPSKSTNDFPRKLIDEYSHWITVHEGKHELHFRPRHFSDEEFEKSCDFILDLEHKLVRCTNKPGWHLVDIASDGHRQLCSNIFQRVSLQEDIHVFARHAAVCTAESDIAAEVQLPRLANHRFEVVKLKRSGSNSWNDIRATDHRNLLVATNQNCGTLIGLNHGLLLEGAPRLQNEHENRVLLMPHGKVSRNEGGVSVDVENLHQPPFFKYEIRDDIGDLHPPKARQACTYLALLHGSTSGLFADPYLEMDGTQKALSLVRSARCSGNLLTGMGDDSVAALRREIGTLLELACLSPARSYYPTNMREMEVISYPSSFESLCAHNAFAFMAKQRITDMIQAAELVGKSIEITDEEQQIIDVRTGTLSMCALLKSMSLYPMDCNATDTEMDQFCGEEAFGQWKQGSHGSHFQPDPRFAPATQISISQLGSCASTGKGMSTDTALAKTLLQKPSLETLCGRQQEREGRRDIADITCWANVISKATSEEEEKRQGYTDFSNTWISLYNLARSGSSEAISDSGRLKFGLLIGFLGQRYPENTEHLAQLLFVREHRKKFNSLDPPAHRAYVCPSEDSWNRSEIDSIAEQHLHRFTEAFPKYGKSWEQESWRNRKRQQENLRRASKAEILSAAEQKWERCREISSSELPSCEVTSRHGLAEALSARLRRWKQAEDLTIFISKYQKLLADCGHFSHPFRHVVIADVKVAAPVKDLPVQFRLQTFHPQGHLQGIVPVEATGITFSNQCMPALGSEGLENTNCCGDSVLPLQLEDILSMTGPEHTEMARFALEKMQRGWKLAQRGSSDAGLADALEMTSTITTLAAVIEKYAEEARRSSKLYLQHLRDLNKGPIILETPGLWNKHSRMAMLSRLKGELCSQQSAKAYTLYSSYIGFGIAVRESQRAKRCLRMLDCGEQHRGRLLRELQNWEFGGLSGITTTNKTHGAYDPHEHPEWLLLELDNDYCIRPTQAEVSLELLSSETNRLLKLNMGEGKTDVIIPMVVSAVGAKNCHSGSRPHVMARVTVLASLYPNNASTWQWRLGGFLDQRVYPMIFRRDLDMGGSRANLLLKTLTHAYENGHVIVTIPEHRLSFENKVVELASKVALNCDPASSAMLLKIRRYLNGTVRDFLDESDLILSPKYQLVYTLGNAEDMDGGMRRWAIAAAALQTVSSMAAELHSKFPKLVEVHIRRKPLFSAVRLLEGESDEKVWQLIRNRVYEDIVHGRGLGKKQMEVKPRLLASEEHVFRELVMRPDMDVRTLDRNVRTSLSDGLVQLALILRGLLSHDALRFALSKRWRVDFGAHKARPSYLMAVPFRAKDVAAERTEFKHPEVMLLLTLRHYYEQGLTEKQLRSVFEKLNSMPEAEAKTLFNGWADQNKKEQMAQPTTSTENMPSRLQKMADGVAKLVLGSSSVSGARSPISAANAAQAEAIRGKLVLDFNSVNLSDPAQFQLKLTPQFQHHIEAIDFFLFKKVFPVQAKQFPLEISANSWDLCPTPHDHSANETAPLDQPRFATAGFSGTDNLEPVLPATVEQRNLDSLEAINGLQVQYLLRPENNMLTGLRDGTVARTLSEEDSISASNQILNLLSHEEFRSINVVLDPGALILEFSNADFAMAWLRHRDDMEAAIFFDDQDRECVITRASVIAERVKSPYADDLSKCLVYLDDVHTRGVDFLLPPKSRAVLTLGRGMCDAKLLQAAWRMRQLGHGQSLHFIAPQEVWQVLETLRLRCKKAVPAGRCLTGGIETVKAIVGWAVGNSILQNCNLIPYFAAQGAAHLKRRRAFSVLGTISSEAMQEALEVLAEALVNSDNLEVHHLYGAARAPESLPNIVKATLLDSAVMSSCPQAAQLAGAALNRIRQLAPAVKHMQSKFGNEMERELEQELEEEINIEKPGPADPVEPSLSRGIENFIRRGAPDSQSFEEIYALCENSGALQHTSLNSLVPGQFVTPSIYVSRDFCRTVKSHLALQDGHTKTPEWLLDHQPTGDILLISNFEAEQLSKSVWSEKLRAAGTRLRLFSPVRRLQQEKVQLTCDEHFVPPTALHVYAGSIQARDELLKEMTLYMGLIPVGSRLKLPATSGHLATERDGFVKVGTRELIPAGPFDEELVEEKSLLLGSPFQESPITLLHRLYSNVYSLSEELSTSTVGRVIGAAELGGEE